MCLISDTNPPPGPRRSVAGDRGFSLFFLFHAVHCGIKYEMVSGEIYDSRIYLPIHIV